MKKIHDVENLKAYQICDEIMDGKSLLLTLGSWKQYLLSLPLKLLLKIVCFFVLSGVFQLPCEQQHLTGRKKLTAFLSRIAPFEMLNGFSLHYTDPLVIGFNHSSTGDTLRLAAKLMSSYPAKALYFPIKLSYYESMAPIARKLERLSIFLYPLITPNMMKSLKTEENFALVERLKLKLERYYLNAAELCCSRYGALVVAPSATCKPTVFDSREQAVGEDNRSILPTMSLLLRRLKKNRKVLYVAVSLNPPAGAGKGLNLFESYSLEVAKEFDTAHAEELDRKNIRGFDYAFLKAIANNLPYKRWHPLQTKDYPSAP